MANLQPKLQDISVDYNNLPKHIAIIMDGNGRWAKKRNLPRTSGHAVGAETFRKIATFCKDIGVDYLTVYAFSTENWKRSENEINAIMKLLKKYLLEAIDTMEREHIKMEFFGDLSKLSPELLELCAKTREISKKYEGFQANICLNYGGRNEIINGIKRLYKDCENGLVSIDDLTEKLFSSYLYSKDVPDPDLIIRPSGEIRTSNFLLWQSAYSEYYFTDVLWPDFSTDDLLKAIASYQNRSRRFGGYKK